MLFFLLLLALLVPILEAASKYPLFTIKGVLTCRGKPMEGNIIMVDDNYLVSHLLSEKTVRQDGKFRMAGEPKDESLDVLLVVEHRCHGIRGGRHDSQKILGYSEFQVHVDDLRKSGWNLEMDIELLNNTVRVSSPAIPVWKAFLYGKRMVLDTIDRIKDLSIWNKV
ncbi:unnamed protein product [Caenorhabditis sp. 36 PRJEB53466]|nr:unnamed protein product [Caenorhabditis sp. 36 PRJEB53466]